VTDGSDCAVIPATIRAGGLLIEYTAHLRFRSTPGCIEEVVTDLELTIDRELLPASFLAWLDVDANEEELLRLLRRDALARHNAKGVPGLFSPWAGEIN
jgi:hypothetical protein